jgi:hypothetical protein
MGRYQLKRYQPLLEHIPEECFFEEGLYCTKKTISNRLDDEAFMSMWRDILFIWIIFPALLFVQFHLSLGLEDEDMSLPALSWRNLAPAILLFSASSWFYRRNVCMIDNADVNDDRKAAVEPLPLALVLLPEMFVGTVVILASVLHNATRALDVLLTSIVILSALAACLSRPSHENKNFWRGKSGQGDDSGHVFCLTQGSSSL